MKRIYFDRNNKHDEAMSGTCTLSDNDLTVQINHATNIGTNIPITKGKLYWEIKILSNSRSGFIGIVGRRTKNSERLLLRFFSSGKYRLNYMQVEKALSNAFYHAGSIVGFAFDVEEKNVDIYINGTNQGRIYLITNQESFYPAIGNSTSGDYVGFKATANFGQTPFSYPIPKGYDSLVKRYKYLYLKNKAVYGMQATE